MLKRTKKKNENVPPPQKKKIQTNKEIMQFIYSQIAQYLLHS